MTTRKEQDAHRIIDRYTLTGCYTVDDWNVYAAACKVLGMVPMIDPRACPVPINRVSNVQNRAAHDNNRRSALEG